MTKDRLPDTHGRNIHEYIDSDPTCDYIPDYDGIDAIPPPTKEYRRQRRMRIEGLALAGYDCLSLDDTMFADEEELNGSF